jgi:hypothetical protein
MFDMSAEADIIPDPIAAANALIAAFLDRRMHELMRLRLLGVQVSQRLSDCAQGKLSPEETESLSGKRGLVHETTRVGRAMRQIVALELELIGLRKAPNRNGVPNPDAADAEGDPADDGAADDGVDEEDDAESPGGARRVWNENDYDRRPLDQVVARIRRALRVEPPLEDPFAPPPQPRAPTAKEPRMAPPPRPAPQKAAPNPVAKPAAAPQPAPAAKPAPVQPQAKAKKHRKRKEPRRPDARMVREWLRAQERAKARPPPD